MEETKIEKLEETPQPVLAPEFNYEKLAEAIIEKQKKEIPKVELAEKKTVQKASNTNEDKEILLQRQFRHLGDRAIKHLVQLKDNRKFMVDSEDGLTVKEIEEKW